VARALDVVGDRWTLLVVRELLSGPKRFKDIAHGLPGIGTGLLAARLKALEEKAVIQRVTLPPPAGSSVYELTESGKELEPVIFGLARWGIPRLGEVRVADHFRPGWAVLGMQVTCRPDATVGLHETYEFRIGEEVIHVRVEDGSVRPGYGPAAAPVLTMTMDPATFRDIISGAVDPPDALASGALRLEGDNKAIGRMLQVFELPITNAIKQKAKAS
jgi:DNA-binding HxlR family transcriptional regulator/putative sterol carrier protein